MFYRTSASGLEPIGPREFEGIAATSALQADGYALQMSGADLSRLQTQGVLLLNHDASKIVGKIVSARATANTLPIRAAFPSAGISPTADETAGLVREGILCCLSLGFNVDDAEPIDPRQPRSGMRATAWTAYEISLVAVPLDVGAVVTARSLSASQRAIYNSRLAALMRAPAAATGLALQPPVFNGDLVRYTNEMRDHLLRQKLYQSPFK